MRKPPTSHANTAGQILALLRAHQSEWRQRYQLQRIGLYSFGEACGYGSTARNQATASSDGDGKVELEELPALSSRNPTWRPWPQAMPPVAARGWDYS
jgi:hypothetical protein